MAWGLSLPALACTGEECHVPPFCVTESGAHLPCPSCARRNAAASAGLLWHQGLGDVPLAGKRSWKQNIPVRNIKLYVFLRTETECFGRTLVWLHIEQLPPDVAAQRDNNHPLVEEHPNRAAHSACYL